MTPTSLCPSQQQLSKSLPYLPFPQLLPWELLWQQVWWLTQPGWLVPPSLPLRCQINWIKDSSGKCRGPQVQQRDDRLSVCPSPLFLLTDFLSLPHRSVEPAVFFLSSRYDCGGQTQLFIAILEQLAMTAREEERETFKAWKTASS